ncbi:MAG: hypothetical protein HY202_07075 [Nitrospirae bacterium]|nr:hypothetical protein [Nitrospirota bacterium]
MNYFFVIIGSLIAVTTFNQPAFGQFAPLPSPEYPLLPGFSSTPVEESTGPGIGLPDFSLSAADSGTASPEFSTTSSEKTTLPLLEAFPLKPLDWENWSVGLLIGIYHPSLNTLNHILADNRIGILQDPNFLLPGNPDFNVTQRNIAAPDIFGLGEYGFELHLDLNPKYSFTLAFSSWAGESRAEDSASIFTRSNQPSSIVPRDARYNVLINQLWSGLRYHFYNEPGKKKFYVNLGLIGGSAAYLTMDSLERVITNNNLSFDSVSVTEASGYGFTTRFGAGGEYYFARWLSIGANVNYVVGKIATLKVSRFFASGFANPPPPPPDSSPPDPSIPIPKPVNTPVPGDTITYAPMKTVGAADYVGDPQDLSIDLDGFDITFYIQFHF